MILRYEHGKLVEQRTYREALQLEDNVSPVISIVGAGGKTTTIHQIAQEYVKADIPVIVTTTTHMRIEEEPYFLLEEEMLQKYRGVEETGFCREIEERLAQYGQVWVGKENHAISQTGQHQSTPFAKMQCPSENVLSLLRQWKVPLLIEADGARMLPCKAPGEQEPVLVQETTMVMALYGLDSIGKEIQTTCFRPELVAKLLGKQVADQLTPEDIALLAMHEQGGRKGVKKDQQYIVVLNKADNEIRKKDALRICERIAEIEHESTDKRGRRSGNWNCRSLVSMWT